MEGQEEIGREHVVLDEHYHDMEKCSTATLSSNGSSTTKANRNRKAISSDYNS